MGTRYNRALLTQATPNITSNICSNYLTILAGLVQKAKRLFKTCMLKLGKKSFWLNYFCAVAVNLSCFTWLSGLFTVKYPTQMMTSCSTSSEECWEQYQSSELIICRNARDRPSAPRTDWRITQVSAFCSQLNIIYMFILVITNNSMLLKM